MNWVYFNFLFLLHLAEPTLAVIGGFLVCNLRYGPEYLSIVASQKRCNKATLSRKFTPRLIFDLLSKRVSRFERKTKESGEAI